MFVDPETGELKNGVVKTNYTHDYLIKSIIANPAMDQKDLAKSLGYSEAWISMIFASDAFQAKFAEAQEKMVDPVMRHSLEHQFKALCLQSAAVLQRKLEATQSPELAHKILETTSKALGFGARVKVEGTVQHNHSLVEVLRSLPAQTRPERVLNSTPVLEPAK